MLDSYLSVSPASGYSADFVRVFTDVRGPLAVVMSNKCNDRMSDYGCP
jgi:hypothetical protein